MMMAAGIKNEKSSVTPLLYFLIPRGAILIGDAILIGNERGNT